MHNSKNIMKTLEAIKNARSYRDFREVGELDAVVVPTSPAHWMDIARADSAVNAVEELYGSVKDYGGLWIAAGQLNENQEGRRVYEGSQKKDIVDRLVERGVNEKDIIQIEGVDTVDKVRELRLMGSKLMGISSYPLHIARFNLALQYAKKQRLFNEESEMVGIPTNEQYRPKNDKKMRPISDKIYGWLALMKDVWGLETHGFARSRPERTSTLHKWIRKFNHAERDVDRRGQ